MHALGSPLVYRVPEARHAKTLKHDKTEVTGSAYHPEMTEFAGLVAGTKPDGKYDIVIFPPNRTPVTINDVTDQDLDVPSTTHHHADLAQKKSR